MGTGFLPRLFVAIRLSIMATCFAVISLAIAHGVAGRDDVPPDTARLLVPFAWSCGLVFLGIAICLSPRLESVQVVPRRVREAFDTMTQGLVVLDETARIIIANQAFVEMTGLEKSRLFGRRAGDLNWICSDATRDHDFPWNIVLSGRSESADGSCRDHLLCFGNDSGGLMYFAVTATSIHPTGGPARGVLVTFRDVTEMEKHRADAERRLAMLRVNREQIRRRNRELEDLANHDGLTGCLDRRVFEGQLQKHFDFAQETKTDLCCLMVDCDHFKKINDQYGHSVGDDVLRKLAATLKSHFSADTLPCRYGGEEFVMSLPEVSQQRAVETAESIRRSVEAIRLSSTSELRLSVSIGVSDLRWGALTPAALIAQADKALYVAKSRGRNTVVAFDQDVAAADLEALSRSHAEDGDDIPFHAVMGLVSALAYRDTRTAAHCRRVARLCVRAATGLMDQRSTYVLETAALLHDIGKIALPDEVLQKPGPLTPDQWRMVTEHHRIGVEIVQGTFRHAELREIVRTHMAYYSGPSVINGLPSGTEIPLAARLLTIADTYDVITSDRPHRAGRGHDDAIRELRRCAGKQFDPELVEHFIEAIAQVSDEDEETTGISKQTALEIGLNIEPLASAIDSRNVANLRHLATSLGAMANQHEIPALAWAANRLQADAAQENLEWIRLLEDTQRLLHHCRATQQVFLRDETAQSNSI